MGGAMGVQVNMTGIKIEGKDTEDKDDRRRNSLAFYVSQFVSYEGDDFANLLEIVKKDKYAKFGGKPPTVRPSKFNKIADSIVQGNMKELRNQVFVFFKHINRKYKDHHGGNCIIHMLCQEGYYNMLTYLLNPANRSGMDSTELEIAPRNDRNRTPLFLCFTPPAATYNGLKNGLDEDGNVRAEKPEEIEQLSDWCKPGGPKSRENCVKVLLENGCPVNEKDYHDFTALHYASIWGWTTTVKLLVDHGADVNAATISGRTALMFAVEFDHEALVLWLCAQSKKLGLRLDATDAEGYSALILAVDKGEAGFEMAKTLLQFGADPNILTLRRKTALKIACQSQNVQMVNLLFDHKVQRRLSALNLLRDEALTKIQKRILDDEIKEKEEAERLEREQEAKDRLAMKKGGGRLKNPFEAWVEYRDKVSKRPFYYNTVTRKSTFDKPREFKPNKKRVVKDVIFGMSFYH